MMRSQWWAKSLMLVSILLITSSAGLSAGEQGEIESIRVPFAILVSPDYMKPHESGCRVNADIGWASLEAVPTPYAEVKTDTRDIGRIVNADQSPIPGSEGCLFEYTLRLEPVDSYQFRFVVYAGNGGEWTIDLGTLTFGEIIASAPNPLIFYLDADAFNAGNAAPITVNPGTPESTPNLQATIDAQQDTIETQERQMEDQRQKIHSLEATIGAMATPES